MKESWREESTAELLLRTVNDLGLLREHRRQVVEQTGAYFFLDLVRVTGRRDRRLEGALRVRVEQALRRFGFAPGQDIRAQDREDCERLMAELGLTATIGGEAVIRMPCITCGSVMVTYASAPVLDCQACLLPGFVSPYSATRYPSERADHVYHGSRFDSAEW